MLGYAFRNNSLSIDGLLVATSGVLIVLNGLFRVSVRHQSERHILSTKLNARQLCDVYSKSSSYRQYVNVLNCNNLNNLITHRL